MSVYQTLSLMIAFAVLIVEIMKNDNKNNRPASRR
ncbi:putative holin-like toxin [Lacticaseibacillus paracasei]|nr:putative holin-like toxin [Lacticaseibacillus paracasei]UWP76178.1 putative holin-like toxin [Lacticaseibacillus paracasei]